MRAHDAHDARGARGEGGSAAVEAVVGVPAFMLLVTLIFLGGRTATTHEALQSAAADGARSASLARDARIARTEAREAVTASITNQKIGCRGVTITVDTGDFAKRPGVPGSVEVTVACRLDLADLALPGTPGSRTLRATMTSPIDTWRER